MKNRNSLRIACVLLLSSCVGDQLDYVEISRIHGELLYLDAEAGTSRAVPAGTLVRVNYKGADAAPAYTFKTAGAGMFSFAPQVEGHYDLRFSFEDTVRQFKAELVEKQDVDTTRADAFTVIRYSGELKGVWVDGDNAFYKNDVILQPVAVTGLRLLITDEQGNPLRGIRVCLYDNKTYAIQNAPYCGGSIAYLDTDEKGLVFFAGLSPKAYFLNARGKVGVAAVSNTWSEQMRVTPVLTAGEVTSATVVLK